MTQVKDFALYAQILENKARKTDDLAKQVADSQGRIKGMIVELQALVDKYSVAGTAIKLASREEHRGRPSAFSIRQKQEIIHEDGTVKKICEKHHISIPTYYSWKRKVG